MTLNIPTKALDKKGFIENLKEIHAYRKDQWKELEIGDFIDEGSNAMAKVVGKIAVGTECILYNSLLKAVIDTYVRNK